MKSAPDITPVDERVRELQSWSQDIALAAEYPSVYNALALLVDPPGGANLLKAAQATAQLVDSVPWLLAELTAAYPHLQDLPALGRVISTVQAGEIAGKGFARHRVLVALRRGESDDPCDRPLRSIVLTLAARQAEVSDPRRASAITRCIDTISSAIGGLYRHRRTDGAENSQSPLLSILAECADAESLQDYVNQLQSLLSAHPERHQNLELRVRRDLHYALGLTTHPHKPLPGPGGTDEPNVTDLPDDDDDPDYPTIQVLLGPIDEAPDPEPDEESHPAVTVAGLPGKSGRQVRFNDLLAEAHAASRPQSIRHANELLLDLHVDVLTGPEIELLAPSITTAGLDAVRDGNVGTAIHLAIACLVLALGYEPKRAAALLIAKQSQNRPYLSPRRDCVVSPALQPHNAFSPEPENQGKFISTASSIRIPLPPPIVKLLNQLPWNQLDQSPIHSLYQSMSKSLGKICHQQGLLAVTMGRIRRTCSARLYEHTRDLPAVMHLTRDTFGASLAPIFYCSLEESYLQKVYRGAIWSIWNYPAEQADSTEGVRVGSRGFVDHQHARKVVHSIGAAFHKGIPKEPDRDALIWMHNTMMAHTTGMLMSVIGHRPVNALFRLTAHDFDLNYHAAVFRDKQVDAAHMYRLVALGSCVAAQIVAYLDHLDVIQSNSALPEHTRVAVTETLSGRSPLFFRLSNTAAPETMSIALWRDMSSAAWKTVQTNWGRHYLASEGRALDISPELLHIQLGHLESVGFPYSPDSPMEPLLFLERMGTALDEIYRRQGWSFRRVVKQGKWRDRWETLGSLHRWDNELEQQATWIKEERAKLRHKYRSQQLLVRERAEDLVIMHANKVDESFGALLAYRIHDLRRRRGPIAQKHLHPDSISHDFTCPEHVPLSTVGICQFLDAVNDASTDDKALNIAAHNTIARCLRWAATRRRYTGFVPGFWLFRAPADPSPFLPSHMRATRQIKMLRSLCKDALTSTRFQTDVDYQLGTLLLSIIVNGGIDDHRSLRIIADPTTKVLSIPALHDALIASSPEGGQVGLRQTAALCYAALTARFVSRSSITLERIEASLSIVIPHRATSDDRLLESLLKTMLICNRLERSGLANLALNPDVGSVALPHDRLMQLLGHTRDFSAPSQELVINSEAPATRSQAKEEYKAIKRIWPNKARDIYLPLTDKTVELLRRQHPSRQRRVYEELLALSEDASRSFIGRSLAGWLAWSLINRRPNQSTFLAYTNVYSGFTEFGKRVIDHAEVFPDDLDTRELEDIYLEIIESAAATNSQRLLRSIKDYHKYLMLHHGADPISFKEINLSASSSMPEQSQIDNQMVLPKEENLLRRLLGRSAYEVNDGDLFEYLDRRLIRQVGLIFNLLAATGARIMDILGLRRRDVILVEKRIFLIIRKTGYRPVKTQQGRRLIDLTQHMDASHCADFIEWIRSDLSVGNIRSGSSLIFVTSYNTPLKSHVVRKVLKTCYNVVSKCNLKSHHLRHTVISNIHCRNQIDVELNRLTEDLTPNSSRRRVRLPRDLHRDGRQAGHKLPRTGIRIYSHTPWAYALQAQSATFNEADRHTLAACLGIGSSGADNRLQSHGAHAVGQALRDTATLLEANAPEGERQISGSIKVHSDRAPKSAYVDACGRGVPKHRAAQVCGLLDSEVSAIDSAAQMLTDHADIALIPGIGHSSSKGRSTPRWYGKSKRLREIWTIVENDGPRAAKWIRIAEQWYAHRMRSDHGKIRLPNSTAQELLSIISAYGFRGTYLPCNGTDGLVAIEIRHPSTDRSGNHIIAWVLAVGWVIVQAKYLLRNFR